MIAAGGWHIAFGMGQHESYHITNRICTEARFSILFGFDKLDGESRIIVVSYLDEIAHSVFFLEYDSE